MSGTPNPSVNVGFGDGNGGLLPSTPDSVMLVIGAATAGPFNKPRRASSMNSVINFNHGPLVAECSHHVTYSQPCVMVRCGASTPGTNGAVTKTPAASSLGTVALSATSTTLHATVVSQGQAENITTGWITPPAPLPMAVTLGAGGFNGNVTVNYLDEGGNPQQEVLAFTGPGTKTTVGNVGKVVSVVTSADPVGTLDFSETYNGPQDRYDCILQITQGGQLAGGSKSVQAQVSLDNGRTYGPSYNVPASGILDLLTYPGGLTPACTGVRATLSSAAATQGTFGSVKAAGADFNGDLLFTMLRAGVTVAIVVAGNNTPLTVAVAGAAITINAATSAGGAITSTGATILAAVQASAQASALVRVRSVGTGLSLSAALAAAGTTNGDITWTAKQENVQVQLLESGANSALNVLVAGTQVQIFLATDANGEQTSTAAQVVAAVAGSALASKLLSGVAGGSGASLAGDTTAYVSLPVQFSTGDLFSFSTTPPLPSNFDLATTLAALAKNPGKVLDNVSAILFVKDGATDTDFATLLASIAQFSTKNKDNIFGVVQGDYQGTTDPTTWADNIIAEHPTQGQPNAGMSIVCGEVDTLIPAYGTSARRNFATLYMSRVMNIPLSEFASHVECETLNGTQYSLEGVGTHLVPGGDPTEPEYTSMWQDDDTLLLLHEANMVTPCGQAKIPGVFVRQSVQYVPDGDDWIYLPFKRVGNAAADLAYLEMIRFLNADLLTDPTTGQLDEGEHQKLEDCVTQTLAPKLYDDNGVRHVTAFDVVSDRSIDFAATGEISIQINFVGKYPVLTFNATVNASKKLASQQAQTAQ